MKNRGSIALNIARNSRMTGESRDVIGVTRFSKLFETIKFRGPREIGFCTRIKPRIPLRRIFAARGSPKSRFITVGRRTPRGALLAAPFISHFASTSPFEKSENVFSTARRHSTFCRYEPFNRREVAAETSLSRRVCALRTDKSCIKLSEKNYRSSSRNETGRVRRNIEMERKDHDI